MLETFDGSLITPKGQKFRASNNYIVPTFTYKFARKCYYRTVTFEKWHTVKLLMAFLACLVYVLVNWDVTPPILFKNLSQV